MTRQHLHGFFAGVGLTFVATAALFSLSGFQATSMKVGTVDAAPIFNDSEEAKRLDGELQKQANARQGILEFIQSYPGIAATDAQRFRDLTLKANGTDADKAEIEKIRNAAIADEQKNRTLTSKANPSPDDLKAVEAYRTRTAASRELLGRWSQEFRDQLAGLQDKSRQTLLAKLRTSISEVGKKGGYTVIYDQTYAPYAANDVSDEVKKTLDAKK